MPQIRLVGKNWQRMVTMMQDHRHLFRNEFRKIIKREAVRWHDAVKDGLKSGAPGGRQLVPLSKSTKVTRRIHSTSSGYGIRSFDKPLVATGALMDGLRLVETTDAQGDPAVFVGYVEGDMHGAPPSPSFPLTQLALQFERGKARTVVSLTGAKGKRMLSFLTKLWRAGGLDNEPREGMTIVIRHPARPFLAPAFNQAKRGMRTRLNDELAQFLRRLMAARGIPTKGAARDTMRLVKSFQAKSSKVRSRSLRGKRR
jgi:hypothetical protein